MILSGDIFHLDHLGNFVKALLLSIKSKILNDVLPGDIYWCGELDTIVKVIYNTLYHVTIPPFSYGIYYPLGEDAEGVGTGVTLGP